MGATAARRLRPRLKQSLYAGARAAGLFRLSRVLTRDALRIVCWHGTSLADEHRVFPGLFLSPDALERRLLALHRHPVLPLEEAVRRLRAGTLPPAAVALTIDDGFFGTLRHAWPALQRHGFPATLYATTYHVQSGTPVFRLLVQWIFDQSRVPVLDLSQLGVGMVGAVRMGPGPARTEAMWRLIRHAEERMSEPERQALADRVAGALGVDLAPLREGRWLSLASTEELRLAAREGLDVQLHTHRHRFPAARDLALRELRDNRAVLEPAAGRALRHFCYPSGYHRPAHLPWLEEAQVESATTCDPGMNRRGDSLLTLRRFLDSSETSQLEFEAELSGFSELLRQGARAGAATPGPGHPARGGGAARLGGPARGPRAGSGGHRRRRRLKASLRARRWLRPGRVRAPRSGFGRAAGRRARRRPGRRATASARQPPRGCSGRPRARR